MIRELTCIVCPKGCGLRVELAEDKSVISITGHTCKRGEIYAKTECTSPMRTLTSTVACENGGVVSVKTNKPIPKELMFACMEIINSIYIPANTPIGTVVAHDILGMVGTDLITTSCSASDLAQNKNTR